VLLAEMSSAVVEAILLGVQLANREPEENTATAAMTPIEP